MIQLESIESVTTVYILNMHFASRVFFAHLFLSTSVRDILMLLFGILQRIDYLTYLETFDRLFDIAKEKKNPEYRRYVDHLNL